MTNLAEREQLLSFFNEAVKTGARTCKAAAILGLNLRTLQRWQQPEIVQVDRRTLRQPSPSHKLSDEERTKVLEIANCEEFKGVLIL